MQVNMLEAKTQLSKLVDAVQSGAEPEVIIARDGKPAARIVPLECERGGLRLGLAEGKFPPFDYEAFQAMDEEITKLFNGEDD